MKKNEKQKFATDLEDEDPEWRMILALLRKPMNMRMNWLRKRLPNGGSCV